MSPVSSFSVVWYDGLQRQEFNTYNAEEAVRKWATIIQRGILATLNSSREYIVPPSSPPSPATNYS